MRVKVIVPAMRIWRGTEIDVDEHIGQAWQDAGMVEVVQPVEPPKPEPVIEQAVGPGSRNRATTRPGKRVEIRQES